MQILFIIANALFALGGHLYNWSLHKVKRTRKRKRIGYVIHWVGVVVALVSLFFYGDGIARTQSIDYVFAVVFIFFLAVPFANMMQLKEMGKYAKDDPVDAL